MRRRIGSSFESHGNPQFTMNLYSAIGFTMKDMKSVKFNSLSKDGAVEGCRKEESLSMVQWRTKHRLFFSILRSKIILIRRRRNSFPTGCQCPHPRTRLLPRRIKKGIASVGLLDTVHLNGYAYTTPKRNSVIHPPPGGNPGRSPIAP